jgi:zinc protease
VKLLRAIAALVIVASVAHADRKLVAPESLPIEHMQLANGLQVILARDASATAVAIHVRYEAGAASERSTEAGYTHLVETLLGEGSVHVKDFTARIEAAGGWATTATTTDALAMTEQVPAHALELALWLEAERMAGLADGITATGLAHARELIHAEWRAAYVEDPHALVAREVQRALWTGVRDGAAVLADIPAADVEAVRRFARERLVPNRATVVIAGRFDVAATRTLVRRYFAWIPAREGAVESVHDTIEPRTSALTTTVKDPVAKVVVAFRCEPFTPAIDVIGQLLANGTSSRLVAALVNTGLASEVHSEVTRTRAAELRLVATPAPGIDPARVALALHAELARLRAQPPTTAEVLRAASPLVTDFHLAMENLVVRAELLATWTAYGRRRLSQQWSTSLSRMSTEAVGAAISRWLGEHAAVTVIGQPEGT